MSRVAIDDAAIEAEIGRLPDLSLLELRNRWKTLFGHPAPKSLRRNFLARAVTYQMQVEAYGGLSVATKRRLREIATAVRNGDANAVPGSVRIKPGTRRPSTSNSKSTAADSSRTTIAKFAGNSTRVAGRNDCGISTPSFAEKATGKVAF